MNAEFHTLYCISEYIISWIQLFNLGMLKDSATDKIVFGNSEMRAVTCALTTFPLIENSSCTSLATILPQRLFSTVYTLLSYILVYSH